MDSEQFYEDIMLKSKKKDSLAEVIRKEFEENPEHIELFRKGYNTQNKHIELLVQNLTQEIKQYWSLNGADFYKLFDYNSINKEELNLIIALSSPLLSQSNKPEVAAEKRAPQIIEKLIEDDYLLKEELVPEFTPIPERDEFIVQPKHGMFNSTFHYTINEKILQRTKNKFRTPIGTHWSTELAEPIPMSNNNYSINEVRRIVLNNITNAQSGIIPLKAYHAVINIPPNTFFDKHFLELFLKLNIKFPEGTSISEFTNQKKFIKGTIADDKTEFNIGVEENFIYMSVREKTDWLFPNALSSVNVQATKVFLENYFTKKNIAIYSESNASPGNKLILIKKMQSQKFSQAYKEQISSQLNVKTILDIIDYASHEDNFDLEIKFNQRENISGSIRYYDNIIGKSDEKLSMPEVEFPLEQLNILANHLESYTPNVNELETIAEMTLAVQKWNRLPLPKNLVNDFITIYKKTFEIETAAIEQNEWMRFCNTTPNYSEEERKEEPWKRELMKEENRIMGAVSQLRNQVKKEAIRFTKYFQENQPNNPYLEEKRIYDLGEVTIGIHFVKNMYKTLFVENQLKQSSQTKQLINTIEQARKEYHQEKTKEITNLPLHHYRTYVMQVKQPNL